MKSLYFESIKDTLEYLSLNKNKGYILHASIDIIKKLSKSVDDNVVLCSTAGEYTPEGYKQGVVTGFEYNKNIGTVIEILDPPVKSLDKLKKIYEKVEHNENAFMLLLCDGLSMVEERIITTLYFIKDNFKIIGGSAGDGALFKETFIYLGKKKVNSVAIFFDIQQQVELIKENIYVPCGKRLFITDADPINRIVKTFNNRPASSEYARVLGISEKNLTNYFKTNPLGKVYEKDIFIASPMKVNEDKSIAFYCQVMPNTFVEILEPIDPIQKVKETLSRISFKPEFMYVVNCILRSSQFIEQNLWNKVDKKLLDFCGNTTGFISYGEQFYKHHANQTMVVLAIK
jgi:hypothetical protein